MNQNIKNIRKALQLSQAEFAKSLGMEQGSYSDIERGRSKGISKSVQLILEEKYNVNIDYLYKGEGEMFYTEKSPIITAKINLNENKPSNNDRALLIETLLSQNNDLKAERDGYKAERDDYKLENKELKAELKNLRKKLDEIYEGTKNVRIKQTL